MKKLLIVLFGLVMFNVVAQVKLPAPITPNASGDQYPIAFTEHIHGTIKHVGTIGDLSNISIDRTTLGMFATVADEGYRLYQVTGLDPVVWSVFNLGSSGNPILEDVTVIDTTNWGLYVDWTADQSPSLIDINNYIDEDTRVTTDTVDDWGFIKTWAETDPSFNTHLSSTITAADTVRWSASGGGLHG